MKAEYECGAAVRVLRNVRNDGTYPGALRGALLIRRGSVGYVCDVGTFLQDQIVYTVHFIDAGRLVGCRPQELQPESAPWVPSRFEFREMVATKAALAVNGAVIVPVGTTGQVLKVLRDAPGAVAYHVRFPGRTVVAREAILDPADAPPPADDAEWREDEPEDEEPAHA